MLSIDIHSIYLLLSYHMPWQQRYQTNMRCDFLMFRFWPTLDMLFSWPSSSYTTIQCVVAVCLGVSRYMDPSTNSLHVPEIDKPHSVWSAAKHNVQWKHTAAKHKVQWKHTTAKHKVQWEHTAAKHNVHWKHTAAKHNVQLKHTSAIHKVQWEHTAAKHKVQWKHTAANIMCNENILQQNIKCNENILQQNVLSTF